MNKLKKGGHFGKTRWRPLEGIFGVALTLIFLFCYQLAMYQVSCFYHKMHDSSQNCYISAPLIVDKGILICAKYLVVLLTLLRSNQLSEELSYKRKRESKVCSKCHVCGQKKVTMTRKRCNHRPQANPRHRELNTDH